MVGVRLGFVLRLLGFCRSGGLEPSEGSLDYRIEVRSTRGPVRGQSNGVAKCQAKPRGDWSPLPPKRPRFKNLDYPSYSRTHFLFRVWRFDKFSRFAAGPLAT